MTTPTAEALNTARTTRAQEVVDRLVAVNALITELNSDAIGGVDVWLGGLPDSLTQIPVQIDFMADRLRQGFGLTPPQA